VKAGPGPPSVAARAMVLERPGRPLQARAVELPPPGRGQVLLRVRACGVCRTDLHVVDGELPGPDLPLVPGHQAVGVVEARGRGVSRLAPGDRLGVPWLGWTCGACRYCRAGSENLCARARFTGYTLNGGFATHMLADARYCFPIPDGYSDREAAPLLCAGLIGFRALRLAGDAPRLGLYGFGSAAHILTQVASGEGRRVFAFTRPGDAAGQAFARSLGAVWAGAAADAPPEPLDAALLFAPAGELVPIALRAVRRGGCVVCAGIHMSDIPSFPYRLLWEERVLRSVANLTRADGEEFFRRLARVPVRAEVTAFPLQEANAALGALRGGKLQGSIVLTA
jgi:alcohol dehydrogenase, propanol-preferring